MKFLVVGAGAIGVYLGGSLALAGEQVVFLVRAPRANAFAEAGLRLEIGNLELSVPHPQVAEDLSQALDRGPYDALLLAVKSYDTAGFLDTTRPCAERMPVVVSFQNGVENEAAIAAALGEKRVIAGTVTTAVSRLPNGGVRVERPRGVGVAGGNPAAAMLVETFKKAGLRAGLYPEPRAMKWSKMLLNLIANASSAILDMTPAEIFADPKLCALETRQLLETMQVMAAQGISIVDLPGAPVRLLATAVQFLPSWIARPVLQQALGKARGAKMPSFYIDLHTGKGKSEIDFLNGAVVRFGERNAVPTPVNRVLTSTLLDLISGRVPLESYARQPEKLLRKVGK